MAKVCTLYELRRDNVTTFSTALGNRHLRPLARARRLAKRLMRRGIITILVPFRVAYRVNPDTGRREFN